MLPRATKTRAPRSWVTRLWIAFTVIWFVYGLVYEPWSQSHTGFVPCPPAMLAEPMGRTPLPPPGFEFTAESPPSAGSVSTQELLCIGHPATSIERFHIYTAHIKAMLPTPEFLTLLCVPVALLVGVRLIGWILGASPLRLRLTRIQIPPEWSIVWIGVMAGCVIWLWPEQDVSLISYSWGAHDFHRELAAIVVLVTALAGLTIWLIRRKSPGTIAQARDQFGLGDQHEDSQD